MSATSDTKSYAKDVQLVKGLSIRRSILFFFSVLSLQLLLYNCSVYTSLLSCANIYDMPHLKRPDASPPHFFQWPAPQFKWVGRVYQFKCLLGADYKWPVVGFGKYISHSTAFSDENCRFCQFQTEHISCSVSVYVFIPQWCCFLSISEEPHWVEVLTEVLLSLLTRPSSLFRHVVDQVFTILAPHLTRNALTMILEVGAWFGYQNPSNARLYVVAVVVVFGQSTCGDQNHPQANKI